MALPPMHALINTPPATAAPSTRLTLTALIDQAQRLQQAGQADQAAALYGD